MVGDSKSILLKLAEADVCAPYLKIASERSTPDSGYVFPSHKYNGTKPYDFRGLFKNALEESGIEDFQWNDFRKTVCAHLLNEAFSRNINENSELEGLKHECKICQVE